MTSSVWKFSLSAEEMIEKLGDIIQCVSTSQIKMEWSYRAELCMEPAGWDALWRIPSETCHALGVRYPCVVYVTVESLDLENHADTDDGELCATVEVVGVQDDDIHLPAKHEAVPISQLWPLKRQPNTAIDIKPTAEFINLYRYFYSYMWMPWDIDWEEACGSWFHINVPSRVNMWTNAGDDIYELRTIRDEAKKLASKISKFQADFPSDTEDDALDLSGDGVAELMVLHEKMQQLKSKWQVHQNPILKKKLDDVSNLPPQNISVWTGGDIDSYIKYLREANNWVLSLNNEDSTLPILLCSPSLQSAIHSNPPRMSRLFLCPGDHALPTDNFIGKNYTIKSLSNDVKLVCHEERTAALAIVGSLTLDGVDILADACSTVLSVRGGNVTMTQCKLKGNRNSTSQGIIVFPGGKLRLSKCTFNGFFTGIMAHKGSVVVIDGCTFSECGVGVQVCEDARVTMSSCTFMKCAEAGIRYDTQTLQHSIGGDHTLLNSYNRDISCMDCLFIDNNCYEVYIAKQDENVKPEWEEDVATS